MRSRFVAGLAVGTSLFAIAAYAQQASVADLTGPMTPELAAQLSRNVNRPVIVLMRNHLQGARAESDQAAVMSELHQVGARNIKPFRLVNAFAATVSDGEVARLKANPGIAQVAPDSVVHHPSKPRRDSATKTAAAGGGLHTLPFSCRPGGAPQLNPEALLTTGTDSPNTKAKTARSLGATGAGVRVAYIADGIDPNTPNLVRANGKSVFVDYQDFSGDGPVAQPGYDEAILDANSIAGQGTQVYDISKYGPLSVSGPCNIIVQGVAPGADLVGLDVFGTAELTTTSNFLEAIDYAVNVDHVDVLNESYGGNPFPDVTSLDVNKQFNDAAVAAGVTVTVSSGDAGTTNTIGSPSSDPLVIAAGASTTLREYAQTGYAGSRVFATTGWLDDNISALSSAGFTESGRTVDLVAPGDLNWISCTQTTTPLSCTNLFGNPSNFTDSGGTSESAPLTAGAAALVIEAYRSTHGGKSPTPALVKTILTSAANDLGIPAIEQGSGILNTYNAVVLAKSIHTADGAPAAIGPGIVLSQNQFNAAGLPNTPQAFSVAVTNVGASAQTVSVGGRTFGQAENVQSGSVVLAPGANPQFLSLTGAPENYATVAIKVPAGAERLSASIAYQSVNGRAGQLSLIDPKGRFAAYTLPQGVGNFGSVDVRAPTPGTWTGVIFARGDANSAFQGSVQWQAYTQRFVPFATVSPTSLSLSPGQTQTVKVTVNTPPAAGDTSGAIVFKPSGANVDPYAGLEHSTVGVTLRSLVPLDKGGAFSGVLTGGNGRPGNVGQTAYYAFNVPAGTSSLAANVSLTKDLAQQVGAYLVGPDGATRGLGQNSVSGVTGPSLTANAFKPPAGTWTLVVVFQGPIVGDAVSLPFTGNIVLNQVSATAPGLPNDVNVTLPAGVPVTVPVTITNNGTAPNAFFVDARLNTKVSVPLALQSTPQSANGFTLPLTTAQPIWLVPSETSAIATTATATVPVEYDFFLGQGDPDLFGAPTTKDNAAGSYAPSLGAVTSGYWYAAPTEIGPYPSGAVSATVKMTMTATLKSFDAAVSSPTGDLWLFSTGAGPTFAPVVLNPGQSTTVNVTIKPAGAAGTKVQGTIYVDDYLSGVPPYGTTAGNEVAGLPYAYTVGAPPTSVAGN